MRPLLTFFLWLACISSSWAQFNLGFIRNPSVPYLQDATLPNYSTAGGLNTPQFSQIELNGDSLSDLFVFDRSVDVVRTYRRNPNGGELNYAPEFEAFFPDDLKEFVLLRDYDCDGRADIFTYHQAGFRVYRNTTPEGGELRFEKITDQVRSDYGSFESSAFVLAGDVPAIVDVDNDGDLDILAFGTVNSESTIEFHRNLSMDLYNSCDSLIFEVVTQCWGNVQEAANTSVLTPISCKGVVPPTGNRDELHPGSSVLLIDTDGDGDKDLILGDIQTDHVVYAKNTGDAQTATIDVNTQTTIFPNGQDPVNMQYLVSGFEVDVDGDSIQDLLMTVNNSIDSSVNAEHVWYYRNTAANGAPNYVLEQKDFLLDEQFDAGANTSVQTAQLNGDNRRDLLIVVDYRRDPDGSTKSRIYRYDQQAGGIMQFIDNDYANLSNFNFSSAQIAMGDLDGDGDDDMLLGDAEGFIHYFQNNPVNGNANHSLTAPQYMGISTIGNNASPALADMNGDGLLDLIVGERTGVLSYFQNSGTANAPQFPSSPTISNFGDIDVSKQCCTGYATPQVVNDPALGPETYLAVGSDEKRIRIYEVSEDLNATFPLVDSIYVNAGRIDPHLVRLFDEDDFLGMLAGEAGGGILYYYRNGDYPVGSNSDRSIATESSFQLYPNPTNAGWTIAFNSPMSGQLSVYNALGGLVLQETWQNERNRTIDVRLEPGYYSVAFEHASGRCVKPLLILR
jgi:hypothetical protein